jgi:hypothetical protein
MIVVAFQKVSCESIMIVSNVIDTNAIRIIRILAYKVLILHAVKPYKINKLLTGLQ